MSPKNRQVSLLWRASRWIYRHESLWHMTGTRIVSSFVSTLHTIVLYSLACNKHQARCNCGWGNNIKCPHRCCGMTLITKKCSDHKIFITKIWTYMVLLSLKLGCCRNIPWKKSGRKGASPVQELALEADYPPVLFVPQCRSSQP